ncbi:leucine carboxyl methyltransferase Ppm1 [Schizosaccharomyces japonicus yFS275]|uniref:Leucine carboxyl methyltransferase 1 n=1 Tax=Schizosaccharomyces japonicus (strain yFS275 / FY16936) TaxID=402676 RepID=B6K0U5_SCHJY|nr:leucine carboxyl methyltransferase Ppm1 [Schizosaccharomyces japonicus yFS275]EEB07566.1 leucine carboxyl methyltransferase Ppm1 [Schizosaccharomyces japonicus yFS275]
MFVTETDNDALNFRISATKAGYIEDPYVLHFQNRNSLPRPPLINRGTFVRTWSIDALCEEFILRVPGMKQIISLGAGTDTRVFRFLAKYGPSKFVYHEFDFLVNCVKKLRVISRHKDMSDLLGGPDGFKIDARQGTLRSASYNLTSMDINDLAKQPLLEHIRPDLPTILLSECCLCYLSVGGVDAIYQWATSTFPSLMTIIYEPIRSSDPFGAMMVRNLSARGITMPTLSHYDTPDDQKKRMREYGFSFCNALDFYEIEKQWFSQELVKRLNHIEMLDELEEWALLASHYCLVYAISKKCEESIKQNKDLSDHNTKLFPF